MLTALRTVVASPAGRAHAGNRCSIDLAAHPLTSAAQVRNAIANGQLLDVTAAWAPNGPVDMVAPVIGGR